jgi:hypothetical protein
VRIGIKSRTWLLLHDAVCANNCPPLQFDHFECCRPFLHRPSPDSFSVLLRAPGQKRELSYAFITCAVSTCFCAHAPEPCSCLLIRGAAQAQVQDYPFPCSYSCSGFRPGPSRHLCTSKELIRLFQREEADIGLPSTASGLAVIFRVLASSLHCFGMCCPSCPPCALNWSASRHLPMHSPQLDPGVSAHRSVQLHLLYCPHWARSISFPSLTSPVDPALQLIDVSLVARPVFVPGLL